jgi:hypothetical protein
MPEYTAGVSLSGRRHCLWILRENDSSQSAQIVQKAAVMVVGKGRIQALCALRCRSVRSEPSEYLRKSCLNGAFNLCWLGTDGLAYLTQRLFALQLAK